MTFVAADQLDICAMFEEEVDQALSGGWGGSTGKVVVELLTTNDPNPNNRSKVHSWAVGVAAQPDRFKTLWFDHNLNGKIGNDDAERQRAFDRDTNTAFVRNVMHDLYDQNEDFRNLERIGQRVVDEDHDPVYGDFGKVDLYSRTADPTDTANTLLTESTDDEEVGPDGMADNYQGRAAEKCDPDDGGEDACDAVWSQDFEVSFADGIFGCTTTRPVTINCEWDAQGLLKSNPPDTPNPILTASGNMDNFAKCTAE